MPVPCWRPLRWAVSAACWLVAGSIAVGSADEPVEFNRDIRPILADKCFKCHGPDEGAREAELRLDLEDEAKADRGGYQAIAPGKLDDSELIARIVSDDPDERMPPPAVGKALTPREIKLLQSWVAGGAKWQAHWSFLPPSRPELPPGTSESRAIDTLIALRLKREGLTLSPVADRRTLIRRLSFDLTGLPPSSQEVEAFVADKSPKAYERLVDSLLASPHYGERMAMYWLDVVRYADTNGIHGDNHREHAPYRDYVIRAFNENLPFDRFTREQLAGDLLPNPTRSQRVASGYNRLNMTTREGGAQAKEYRAKYAADRVRNASSAWMGATLGCAECHDHKFDPFTSRDFYSFAAFFADIQETAVGAQAPTRVPTQDQEQQLNQLDQQIAALKQQLAATTPAVEQAQAAWEKQSGETRADWLVVHPGKLASKHGAELKVDDFGVIEASGPNPDKDTYTLSFETEATVTALRLELLPDDTLPGKGPGRAGNGNFVLNEFRVLVGGKPAGISAASATHSQKGFNVAAAVDGKSPTGWAILPNVGREEHAVFELKRDLAGEFQVEMVQQYGSAHSLGRFRLSVTAGPRPVRAKGTDAARRKALQLVAIEPGKRTDAQKAELATYYRSIAPALKPVRDELAVVQQQRKALLDAAPQVLVATAGKPRDVRVLPRGNWLDDSGPIVKPDVPGFLPDIEVGDRRATRLDLAEWLVDPANPLVARVLVNRLWKITYGQGLVRSLDDFGSQGTWPTHPRVLDWLAVELVESGWDVKHLVKLMAMSQAYRQSSVCSVELQRRDPYNRLLARQSRFRLDAEMVRDNALAVSGLLVSDLGGRSVKPYQPVGYWKHLNFPKRVYQHDQGPSQYRRGLYTYWCRTFLHPSMLAFDAPTREECTVERPRSNTPQAALVLLNDPTYVEAARVFAERIIRAGGADDAARIQYAFRETLARQATAAELRILTSLAERHRRHYREETDAAKALTKTGLYPRDEQLDAVDVAVWTSVARVVLNLHETITRN